MARRLVTDAKIVLERAGYRVEASSHGMALYDNRNMFIAGLRIDGGTVDNHEVSTLLIARGCDAQGHKRAVYGGRLKDFQAQGRGLRAMPSNPPEIRDYAALARLPKTRAALAEAATDRAAQDAIEGHAGNVGRRNNATRY
jgi:hypothetical protein